MKLKEFINEDVTYCKIEKEIQQWVEAAYNGLSIDFYPQSMEIVQTDESVNYSADDVKKITEVVNAKIGEILEAHAEEIYIAERLTRIWKKHPRFNIEVESIEDIKRNEKFLKYLDELIIRRKGKIVNINDYMKEATING